MKFSISIVSHGSGPLLGALLADLSAKLPDECEVIVTLNIEEDESFLVPYLNLPLTILRNSHPMGFGANHNQAFAHSVGCYFVVVNPDIRITADPFPALQSALAKPGVGACAPVVLSPSGDVEDSVRRFPTILRLAKRVLLRQRRPDFTPTIEIAQPVDWAAGMFVAFDADAFRAIGGFDTRYFMYFEDADICRRLWLSNHTVLLVSEARVIHEARRASRRSARHLRWHLRSAVRFLLGI